MKTTPEKILEKILLPLNEEWEITGISVNEETEEIYVDLRYHLKTVTHENKEYQIYDFRESRSWRHLDLWQYKTYLRARIPRYTGESGVKTMAVPWADSLERMTHLLEKKR